MKIIIAGNGVVGKVLIQALSNEGHDITIIDSNPDVLENSIEQYDVMSLVGNCAAMGVLSEAGVLDTDLLIAATGNDEINLLCCLTAHHLNPDIHTIARIRDLAYEDTVYEMRQELALSLTVNPEKQTAREISHLLKYPGFLKRERFVNGLVDIMEIRIEKGSPLEGRALNEMEKVVKCQTLVCAVLRNNEAIIPTGNFVLQEDDHIFVTASVTNITTLLKNLGLYTRKVHDVILVGGGIISYHAAKRLIKGGIDVKIIERDYETCEQLADLLPKACIIHADASMQDMLLKEGIERCDALVLATGSDELNILLGIYGTGLKIPQVITKVSAMNHQEIINRLNVGSVLSPKELCSNTIIQYVRAMENQKGAAVTISTIANEQVEAIEFRVDENTLHCNEPLKDIKMKKGVLITSITNHKDFIIPGGDSSFKEGDSLVVVTNQRNMIHNLNDIFEN